MVQSKKKTNQPNVTQNILHKVCAERNEGKGERQMTFEEVIELLRREYEKAKQKPFVQYPIAYALYQTWKQVDRKSSKTIKQ